MVAVDGLLEPEAGQTVLAALEPLACPHSAADVRSGGQRRADALGELARRALEGGRLPQTGGVRPQLSMLVDLDSLLDRPGAVGGEIGAVGPLVPEGCRRLACDGAVTRVLVTRQPPSRHTDHGLGGQDPDHDPGGHGHPGHHPHGPGGRGDRGLTERLQTAMARLPPTLGGAPPANRWTWAGPPGSAPPPNAPPWPSATAAVSSPTASGPFPGARPTIWGLAGRRPHRPGQPHLGVPGPSSGGPRGRLAAATRARWAADRHPTQRQHRHRRHRLAA